MNCIRVGVAAAVFSCFLAGQLAAQPAASVSASAKANANKEATWQEKLEAALARKVSLDADAIALQEVLKTLAEQADFQFRLSKKIEDAGVQPDQPVKASFRDLSLQAALKHLLADLSLTFILQDELLVITTLEDAQSPENLLTRVYPVADLVLVTGKTGEGGAAVNDFDPLIDNIVNSIEPDGWSDVGGPALSGYHRGCQISYAK
jgi:hypothetical protein